MQRRHKYRSSNPAEDTIPACQVPRLVLPHECEGQAFKLRRSLVEVPSVGPERRFFHGDDGGARGVPVKPVSQALLSSQGATYSENGRLHLVQGAVSAEPCAPSILLIL